MEISDVLLEYFNPKYSGILLEVGAGHPVNISNSLPFRDKPLASASPANCEKWKIISIEPIPEHCSEFRKMGFEVLQYAAANKDIGLTSFNVSPNLICCSGLEIRYKDEFGWKESDFKVINVFALTVNSILKVHHPEVEKIDILIVDAEGYEVEVMRGFDLKKYVPSVVCIEGRKNNRRMFNNGYRLDKQIYQDRIFVKE